MPTKKLTDHVVRSTKPPAAGRLEFWDALLPGFGVRITDKGARSYFIMYRVGAADGRKQRRFKIGNAVALDLADAREAARAALREVAHGGDPAEDRRPERAGGGESVRTVAAAYLTRYVEKNTRASTYRETKRIFDVDVLPAWGHRAIGSITRGDVRALADKIAGRGAEVQANRVIARLKTFFGWAADDDQGYIAASPVARMKPLTKETERDRVLSDDEIRWFWSGCAALGWPFGPMFRLLLVTLQRRDEVGGLDLGELDLGAKRWTIPRERTKNNRAHEVALSALALDTIAEASQLRPQIEAVKKSRLLFTTTGGTAASGFSRAKSRLDAEMERLARRDRDLPEDEDALRRRLGLKADEPVPRLVPPWTLHDLRRTGATGMAGLKLPPHVVDKILNHVSGTIRGVAAVYNRHAYSEERQTALEAWGRRLRALIEAPSGNIVEFKGRGHGGG